MQTDVRTESRPRNRERGQSLIEMGLVMPILVLLTFGIVDFGLLFYTHLALESAASQAVRYGITGSAMNGMSRQESIKAALRNAAPTLTIDDGDITFSRLAGGNWVNGLGGAGDVERLSINYTHKVFILAPFFPPNGQVTLHAESAMKNEDRFE